MANKRIKQVIKIMFVILAIICVAIFISVAVLTQKLPDQFNVVESHDFELSGNVTSGKSYNEKMNRENVISVSNLKAGSKHTSSLYLFGIIPIKDVMVNVVDKRSVVLAGTPFGIKIFTDGVLIVGMSDVDTVGGPSNPARNAGIKVGDILIAIDDVSVKNTTEVAKIIEKAGGEMLKFRVKRQGVEFDMNFRSEKSVTEDRYKAGIWIRDSSAGVGTMTFYVPETKVFAGLGHAICDVDTGEIMPLSSGEVVNARIYDVTKGKKGMPGELRGGFEDGHLGELIINGETGLYGKISGNLPFGDALPIAMKQQVKEGHAQIYVTIDGVTPEYFDIEIEEVKYGDPSPTRNMIVKITDERLLNKTGGIVQGMSGAPIVQDGHLVGAVTHVFVNDPTKGFAIMAENMLKSADIVSLRQEKNVA